MTNEIQKQDKITTSAIEQALVSGNLQALTSEQRVSFYKQTCDSLGLNPLTKPFGYIQLNGKLTLYALKDCTEQLRGIHGVSVTNLEAKVMDDLYVVIATGKDKNGKTDAATGAVCIKSLSGEAKANAMMKAETKAKRRLTLSICGLGILDESETSSIPEAKIIGDSPNASANMPEMTEGSENDQEENQVEENPIPQDYPGTWVVKFKLSEEQKKIVYACKSEERVSKTSGKTFTWYLIPDNIDDVIKPVEGQGTEDDIPF